MADIVCMMVTLFGIAALFVYTACFDGSVCQTTDYLAIGLALMIGGWFAAIVFLDMLHEIGREKRYSRIEDNNGAKPDSRAASD